MLFSLQMYSSDIRHLQYLISPLPKIRVHCAQACQRLLVASVIIQPGHLSNLLTVVLPSGSETKVRVLPFNLKSLHSALQVCRDLVTAPSCRGSLLSEFCAVSA